MNVEATREPSPISVTLTLSEEEARHIRDVIATRSSQNVAAAIMATDGDSMSMKEFPQSDSLEAGDTFASLLYNLFDSIDDVLTG